MALAEQLTRALERNAVPIFGVSVGDLLDRTTWLVHFRPEANSVHRAPAQNLLQTYAPAADAAYLDEQADLKINEPLFRALTRATFELQANPLWTLQDYRDRIKTVLRSLL